MGIESILEGMLTLRSSQSFLTVCPVVTAVTISTRDRLQKSQRISKPIDSIQPQCGISYIYSTEFVK